jgi:hypothetical protein
MSDEKQPSRRNPAFDLPIYENGFTQFPSVLIDELMPIATGIPASFWKYLLVLWRDTFGVGCDRKGYRASKVMTQFHMDKETAMQWTAALAVSGLFNIDYGRKFAANAPGIPTVFQYRADSTVEDWECFLAALRDELLDSKSKGQKTKREGVWGFRISLSYRVDVERQRRGLPRVWDEWHRELERSGDVVVRDGTTHLSFNRVRTNNRRVRTALDLENEDKLVVQDGNLDWGDIRDMEDEAKVSRRQAREAAKPRTDNLNSPVVKGS